jgi:rhodanese-related sulfurtransferase
MATDCCQLQGRERRSFTHSPMIRECLYLVAVSIALSLVAYLPKAGQYEFTPSRAQVQYITAKEALRAARIVWVDARPREMFAKSRIPGAVHIDEDNWNESAMHILGSQSRGGVIVVYCANASCSRSQVVAAQLQRDLGVKNIYVLKGGWAEWLSRE